MADILLPPWLKFARVGMRYLDATGVSEAEFTGYTRTGSRGGDRLTASLEFTPTGGRSAAPMMERRAVKAFLLSLRGRQNRALLHDPAYVRAGSFPASELLANPTFESGVSSPWASNGNNALSVADRRLRMTYLANEPLGDQVFQNVTLTQYIPYVLRVFATPGRGTHSLDARIGESGVSWWYLSAGAAVGGLLTVAGVPFFTNGLIGLGQQSLANAAGDFVDMSYASLSRGALADSGANYLTQSNDLSHADWGLAGTTVTPTYFTSYDGVANGSRLIEDTSTGEHYRIQSKTRVNAVADWCFAIALRKGDVGGLRDRARLRIVDSGSTNVIQADFDLTAGSISAAAAAGGSATNARAFIFPLGIQWYYCCIIGRMPASDTTIRGVVNLIQNPNTTSYTGASSQNIGVAGSTLAQSSVPVRLSPKTTTAAPTGTAQTGSALYFKGLPASINGLLLPSDQFAVLTTRGYELKIMTAPLNSDAAEMGYAQFYPPLRGSVADNAPIIIHQPMSRFMLGGDAAGWDDEPGVITRASADFVEV